MDFNEIRQAIDDVIDENADHQITAKSLNLLLNDMMTFVKENTNNSSGSSIYVVGPETREDYVNDDGSEGYRYIVGKEENLEINKKAYKQIIDNLNNKIGVTVYFSMTEQYEDLEGDVPGFAGMLINAIHEVIISEDIDENGNPRLNALYRENIGKCIIQMVIYAGGSGQPYILLENGNVINPLQY